MSVRYEYAHADHVASEALTWADWNADVQPEQDIDAGEVVVAFAADEVWVLYGTPDSVRATLTRALAELDAMVAAVPALAYTVPAPH